MFGIELSSSLNSVAATLMRWGLIWAFVGMRRLACRAWTSLVSWPLLTLIRMRAVGRRDSNICRAVAVTNLLVLAISIAWLSTSLCSVGYRRISVLRKTDRL